MVYKFFPTSAHFRKLTKRNVVESAGLFINETWLVQYFNAMEKLSADGDDVSIWELAGFQITSFRSVKVQSDVAQFLADIANKLLLSQVAALPSTTSR